MRKLNCRYMDLAKVIKPDSEKYGTDIQVSFEKPNSSPLLWGSYSEIVVRPTGCK